MSFYLGGEDQIPSFQNVDHIQSLTAPLPPRLADMAVSTITSTDTVYCNVHDNSLR